MLAQVPSPSFNLLNTYNMPASKASTNFPSATNDPYTTSDANITCVSVRAFYFICKHSFWTLQNYKFHWGGTKSYIASSIEIEYIGPPNLKWTIYIEESLFHDKHIVMLDLSNKLLSNTH